MDKIVKYNVLLEIIKVRIAGSRDSLEAVSDFERIMHYEDRIRVDTAIGYRIIKRMKTLLEEYSNNLNL